MPFSNPPRAVETSRQPTALSDLNPPPKGWMTGATRRTLCAIHAWMGLCVGLILGVVCLSGALTVFRYEIDRWANPRWAHIPASENPFPLDQALQAMKIAYPQAAVESLLLPTDTTPVAFAFLKEAERAYAPRIKIALHPETGDVIGPVENELGQFLRRVHVFLLALPRWVVGSAGVCMIVLVVTGLIIHPKILKEWRTLRTNRSLRLFLLDAHKILGLWGVIFHLLIAFTGAWLGLEPLFEAAAKGSPVTKEIRKMSAANTAPIAMPPLERFRTQAQTALPGFEPRVFNLSAWGTSLARLRVTGSLSHSLYSTAEVRFEGATGQLLTLFDPRQAPLWQRVQGLMEPLHFGDFAGPWLKALYVFLGIGGALLAFSGGCLWYAHTTPAMAKEAA